MGDTDGTRGGIAFSRGCFVPVLVEFGVLQPLLGVALVGLHQRLHLLHADFVLGEYPMEDADQLLQAPRLPCLRLHRLLHHRRLLHRRQPLTPGRSPPRLPLCAGRHGGSLPPPRRAEGPGGGGRARGQPCPSPSPSPPAGPPTPAGGGSRGWLQRAGLAPPAPASRLAAVGASSEPGGVGQVRV